MKLMVTKKPKIIAVVGPTASGKSDLAVHLAERFNGEIVSADSRQVYKGLDIGTGKITFDEMREIPHHLLDVATPDKVFTVADYKRMADECIKDIYSRNKIPILCGGTGFYIQSIIDNVDLPHVPPNKELRDTLSKQTTEELVSTLSSLDPERVKTIDSQNKHRLIRAIEIATALGSVPNTTQNPQYNSLQIGIETDDTELKNNIHKRIVVRIEHGMIDEVTKLHNEGLSWSRLNELGLEYRYIAQYLQGIIPSEQELIDTLDRESWKYVKRQRTWFKRDPRIIWFSLHDIDKIDREVDIFLK